MRESASHPLIDERRAERAVDRTDVGSHGGKRRGRYRSTPYADSVSDPARDANSSDVSRASVPTDASSLAAKRHGSGPRIVMLHGFTQTSNCWGPLAEDLATDHELVLVDAPGHGGSDEVHADLETSALLSGGIGGPATYLGYSMGGRTALHLALARPDLVERLILIGATGGLDDEHERADRRDADELLADRVEAIGVDGFVDEWLRQPLFSALAEEVAHRSERCSNTAEGLARSLRTCGTGTQRPLWSELNQLEMPVLVLAGASDAKFSELGTRLCASIGTNASFAAVPESGHSAHLENPAGTAMLIRRWLGRS